MSFKKIFRICQEENLTTIHEGGCLTSSNCLIPPKKEGFMAQAYVIVPFSSSDFAFSQRPNAVEEILPCLKNASWAEF
jgi:hypothetical protein